MGRPFPIIQRIQATHRFAKESCGIQLGTLGSNQNRTGVILQIKRDTLAAIRDGGPSTLVLRPRLRFPITIGVSFRDCPRPRLLHFPRIVHIRIPREKAGQRLHGLRRAVEFRHPNKDAQHLRSRCIGQQTTTTQPAQISPQTKPNDDYATNQESPYFTLHMSYLPKPERLAKPACFSDLLITV